MENTQREEGGILPVAIEAGALAWYPTGGVSRTYREILPRMCDAAPELRLEVITHRPANADLPTKDSIRVMSAVRCEHFLRPQRLWPPAMMHTARRLAFSWAAGPSHHRIWHSTYYTLPIHWQGPLLVSAYDMIHERFPEFFFGRQIEHICRRKAAAVRAADLVICNSEATKRDITHYYGLSESACVAVPLASSDVFRPLATDEVAALSAAIPSLPHEPFLLFVGRRSAHKDFRTFARTLAAVDTLRDLNIVAVGPPLRSEESAFLSALGIRHRVTFYSGLDDQALCLLYNRAAAFVFPSRYEGFGIPLLEALACGCPVVAAAIPTTAEVAGGCAEVFEPGNVESLGTAIERALSGGRNDAAIAERIQRSGAFSWSATARATVELYRHLVGR